ncbi:MAG: hypothetical protein ACR2N0_06590 [Rubrobacteraceae bacterium]
MRERSEGRYFVYDGNHRVSVARHRGAAAIDAAITTFTAKRSRPALAATIPLHAPERPRSQVDEYMNFHFRYTVNLK